MVHRKELQQLLAELKLKKTSQRALIWKALLDSKGHPSVEEIRDKLLKEGHRIGLATIYRTLKILLPAAAETRSLQRTTTPRNHRRPRRARTHARHRTPRLYVLHECFAENQK